MSVTASGDSSGEEAYVAVAGKVSAKFGAEPGGGEGDGDIVPNTEGDYMAKEYTVPMPRDSPRPTTGKNEARQPPKTTLNKPLNRSIPVSSQVKPLAEPNVSPTRRHNQTPSNSSLSRDSSKIIPSPAKS